MAYTALSPPSNWAHAWKTARRLNQGRKAKTKIVTKEFVRIPKVTIPGGFTGDAAFLSLLTNDFVTTFAFPFLPWLSCTYDIHVSDVAIKNALTFFEGKPAEVVYKVTQHCTLSIKLILDIMRYKTRCDLEWVAKCQDTPWSLALSGSSVFNYVSFKVQAAAQIAAACIDSYWTIILRWQKV